MPARSKATRSGTRRRHRRRLFNPARIRDPAMSLAFRSLHPGFAAEVTGIDLTVPISAEDVAAIDAGMDEHAVLIFRDQPLTDQMQLDFTRRFGELENYNTPGHIRKQTASRLGPGMADFSNLDKDGRIMSETDR